MNTCATCANWSEPKEWDVKDAGLGRCSRIKHESPHELFDLRDWEGFEGMTWEQREEALKASRTAKAIEAQAIVVDGSGYRADFYCRPEFGCVLWSEAPKSTKE